MITVGIVKLPKSNEYRVFWKEDNMPIEKNSYYTEDPEDAVLTMLDMIDITRNKNLAISMSDAKYTQNLVKKYTPNYSKDIGGI